MPTETLEALIQSLTPVQREAVVHFIDYMKRQAWLAPAESSFERAADEFIAQHPELLQRLAQ